MLPATNSTSSNGADSIHENTCIHLNYLCGGASPTGSWRSGPRTFENRRGRPSRNSDISVSFLLKRIHFAFSNVFKIKWAKYEDKVNFVGRLVWVPNSLPMNPFPQTKLRGDALTYVTAWREAMLGPAGLWSLEKTVYFQLTPSLITESNTLCFSYTLESMPEILKPVSASTYFIFIFIDNVNVHYQFNIYRCMYVCMYVLTFMGYPHTAWRLPPAITATIVYFLTAAGRLKRFSRHSACLKTKNPEM